MKGPMQKYLFTEDRFFAGADKLRAEFDRRFRDPRETRSDRFVWDFWHVPDQYTLVRTPADHFFPAAAYRDFLKRLTAWGRNTLGCSALTPPWLSYYIEGCEQKLHSDVPHGPWAFVYSLTPPKPAFRGGETLLLRPEVLDYWRGFRDSGDRELSSFVERVAPRFNRLVVFDPRLPHGVTPVTGTMDPREARLVVHGWFTEPKPCLEGSLSAAKAAPILDEAVERFIDAMSGLGEWHGIVSVRISVLASGDSSARVLADTLVPVGQGGGESARVRRLIRKYFSGLRFPGAKGKTEITLPLLFR
jgi:hypothetical protein